MVNAEEFKLCYVDGPWAYFTTKDLDKQWGDDWDDVPYEYNAGPPSDPCWHRLKRDCDCDICQRDWNEDGTPKWHIVKVAIDAPLETPADKYHRSNSPFSVQMISGGQIPWLIAEPWADEQIHIAAGTPLPEFIRLVQKAGGTIYIELQE